MVLWSLFFEALANLVWLSIVKFPVRVVAAVALFGLLGILFPSFCRLPGASIGAALLNEWPRVTYSFFVGTLLYRCDLLEREVERLGRAAPAKPKPSRRKAPRAKPRAR